MKVALVVFGTRGDVHPALELAQTIVADGRQVRFVAPPDFEEEVVARGFESVSIGPSARQWLDAMGGVYGNRGLRFSRRIERFHRSNMYQQFSELPDAVSGCDYVIASAAVFAGATAAELHNLPYRYLAHSPTAMPSAEHSPWLAPFQLSNRWANRGLWAAARGFGRFWASRGLNGYRRKLGLPPPDDILTHLLSRRPVFAVDRPLAPVPSDAELPFDQIRALHPLHGDPVPDAVERFLETGPAPVYVGFGSCPDPDPDATTRILLDAIERAGVRAIISRGWGGLGDGDLPPGVMAIGAVAHQSLFPRLAGAVHHGGAGTTHTAARAGVPQLVVPHLFDMFYFARRVEELGIGPVALPRKRMTAERLAKRIADLIDNPTYVERAKDLAGRLDALGPVEPNLNVVLRPASELG